ncbi:hypothetical protein EES47_07100 [Streptomyces sp. ADI98-12]|uniref:DUF5808 domain-containing protein n=1 Tax=Streptomyces rutgersensis TaxID=53451 RepID=A0ABX6RPX8_9ACTN|nr:hypothetical protein F0345_12030 [Streptomyces rutgersensis]RPK91118.1 hypothetical protein EES47_07100 [Streptomyces sp. ADI98-12]
MNPVLVSLLVNSAVLLLLGAVFYAAPSPQLSPRSVPFGVRVPPGRADAPEVHQERRRYRALLLPAIAVLTAVSLGLGALTDSALVGSVAALALCGVAAVLWFRAHQALTRAKEEGDWYRELRQGAAMDTSLRTDPVRMPWLWVVPSLLVFAVSATAGAFAYPELPDTLLLPERSPSGTVHREFVTTFWSAFSLVLVQLAVTLTMVGTVAAVLRARADVDASRPRASAAEYRRRLSLIARSLLGVGALINVMLLGLSAMMWTGSRSGALLAVVVGVPTVLALAGAAYPFLPMARGAATAGGEEDTGLVTRDDDRFWRGAGTVYLNADDPAVLVPKRVGMGWTVNLANRRFLAVCAVLLVLGAAAGVVLALG